MTIPNHKFNLDGFKVFVEVLPQPEAKADNSLYAVKQILHDRGWTVDLQDSIIYGLKNDRTLRISVTAITNAIVVYVDNGLIPIYFYSVPDFAAYFNEMINKPPVPQAGEDMSVEDEGGIVPIGG